MKSSEAYGRRRDPWIVAFVFAISMAATLALTLYEKQRNFQTGLIRFEQETGVIETSLRTTFDAYAQVLRSGVALFEATENVDRTVWQDYVSNLKLEENYPGIQGLSFNAILHDRAEVDALVADVQANDWAEFDLRPDGERPIYAPILYLEPFIGRNRPALGFDIYSETNRRAAVDRALLLGQPSMTSKITLVQDDESLNDETKAGVLVVLPIFDRTTTAMATQREKAKGLIVSVFRIKDLMETILKANFDGEGLYRKDVSLFEVTPEGELLSMYQDMPEPDHTPVFASENTFSMYGKTWRLMATSTSVFEKATALNSHIIVLLTGVLMSMLLTFLVWGQAVRNRESQRAADALAKGNAQIALLMKEVNHRSKNLLSLIQAIARQTSASNPQDFSKSFSRRLTSLSASQDLLVRNNWEDVDLQDLITSQLGHFKDLIGSRILLTGPKTLLNAANAQTISMAIHELATNATKYGALSNDVGVVNVDWTTTGTGPQAMFELHWVESGGPPVVAPETKGFGSKVTGTMVKLSLEGEIETRFQPEGFEWHLACPASSLAKLD